MFFKLQDVNDGPLRQAAVELGIPNAATMLKDDLIREIKKSVSPNDVLLLAPGIQSEHVRGRRDIFIVFSPVVAAVSALGSVVVAVLTFVIARANVDSAKANADAAQAASGLYQAELVKMRESNDKESAARKEDKKTAWQMVIVYKIIEDGMKTQWNGLTLDEVKRRYSSEAAAATEVELGKSDLQDLALKKIVISLMESNLVYATVEDRYVVQKSFLSAKEDLARPGTFTQVMYAVLNILARESDAGKHTVAELGQIVMGTLKTTTPEEYNAVMAQLAALKNIVIDEKRKVWSAANPPPRPTKE